MGHFGFCGVARQVFPEVHIPPCGKRHRKLSHPPLILAFRARPGGPAGAGLAIPVVGELLQPLLLLLAAEGPHHQTARVAQCQHRQINPLAPTEC